MHTHSYILKRQLFSFFIALTNMNWKVINNTKNLASLLLRRQKTVKSGKATNQILTMVSSLQKKNMKQLFVVWPVYNYTEQQKSREISQRSETKAWPMSMFTNIYIYIYILNHLRQLQNSNFFTCFPEDYISCDFCNNSIK